MLIVVADTKQLEVQPKNRTSYTKKGVLFVPVSCFKLVFLRIAIMGCILLNVFL